MKFNPVYLIACLPFTALAEREIQSEKVKIEIEPAPRLACCAAGVLSKTEPGFLGVRLDNSEDPAGARVAGIIEDSPAQESELKVNDVIVSVNRTKVADARALQETISSHPSGEKVKLKIRRDGKKVRVPVTLGPRPAQFGAGPGVNLAWKLIGKDGADVVNDAIERVLSPRPRARLGVVLQPLTDQLAGFFGAPKQMGALIASVLDDSPANRAGVRAGDVLLAIDEAPINNSADAIGYLTRNGPRDVTLSLLRDKIKMSVKATF